MYTLCSVGMQAKTPLLCIQLVIKPTLFYELWKYFFYHLDQSFQVSSSLNKGFFQENNHKTHLDVYEKLEKMITGSKQLRSVWGGKGRSSSTKVEWCLSLHPIPFRAPAQSQSGHQTRSPIWGGVVATGGQSRLKTTAQRLTCPSPHCPWSLWHLRPHWIQGR